MLNSSSRRVRLALAALSTTCAALLLTSCSTDSPPRHSTRLQKAAGLKTFHIDTSKALWKTTSDQTHRTGPELEIKSKVNELDNGLSRVKLDGVGLANYLRVLDYFAHGGSDEGNFSRFRKEESIRMYDEISKKLDSVRERPDPKDPPLKVVVDDAFVSSK